MNLKNLILAAIFSAITIVFAQITIPIPFTPIPFTLSMVAVYLSGIILQKKYALYSMAIYILLGIIGLPVFGNFSGGVGRILGPTGGYILSYPIMAFITGWILEKFGRKRWWTCTLALTAALLICYLFGSLWYAWIGHVKWMDSIIFTVIPFIGMDVVKVLIFAFLGLELNKALMRAKLLPDTLIK